MDCEVHQGVEDAYLKNPYHNSTHAADVVQGLACLFSNNDFTSQLTDLEMLSMILACVIHDVGHPGALPSTLTSTLYVVHDIMESLGEC